MFARLWKGVHLEARFAGMVLNVVNSTVSGPSELAAFTVDNVELGKPSGNPRVWLTVWHFQVGTPPARGCTSEFGEFAGKIPLPRVRVLEGVGRYICSNISRSKRHPKVLHR